MTFDRHLHGAWFSLRLGLGLMALLAGIDKFFNLLTSWTMYVSPLAERVLPVPPEVLMRVIGLVEIGVGLAILTSWTRAGAYIAAVWLVAIALNLASTGMFLDLAVRDVVLALAAYTLARLTEAETAESVAGNASLGHAHLPIRS
jgi:uncharacterized membrane protein YphA (DoxX/SURF4 family)